MRPAPFTLPVAGQVGARRDPDLARGPGPHVRGGVRRVLEKPAEVAHRPELHGKPQTVDLAAVARDLALVIVAEAKAAGELVR